MRGVLIVLALMAGCGKAPPAPTAPVGFDLKGDVVGTTRLEEVQKKYTTEETFDDGGLVSLNAGVGYTVAGVTPRFAQFAFIDGVLYRIHCDFGADAYDTLLNGLVSKFGKPTSDDASSVIWRDKLSSMELHKSTYHLRIDHTKLAADADDRRVKLKAKEQAGDKAAKDL